MQCTKTWQQVIRSEGLLIQTHKLHIISYHITTTTTTIIIYQIREQQHNIYWQTNADEPKTMICRVVSTSD